MSASSAHQGMIARLPNDWASVTVGELGNVVGGSTPSRDSSHFWGGSYPWVTPGELTSLGAKHVQATREAITRAGLDSCGARLVPVNTLLVTSRATLGSVALAGRELCTNQGFKSVILGSSASPDFYFHLFKTLTSELERRASGTTFLEVSGREFSAVVVPQPPLPEQRQIAAVLDTLDDAIRKTEQIIAKLKQVKQGLLHDLLTRGIDDNGELRDPERHPEQFKDSPLGRIPREWEAVVLGDDARITHGYAFEGQFFTDRPEGPILLTPGNFHRDGGLYFTAGNTKHFTGPIPPGYTLTQGDLVTVMTDLSPRTLILGRAVVIGDSVPLLHNQRIGKVVLTDRARWETDLLCHALNDERVRRRVIREATGTTVRHTSPQRLLKSVLARPSLAEQRRICAVLLEHDERERREHGSAAKLRLLKAGLMEDLLTGRVRVTSLLAEMRP